MIQIKKLLDSFKFAFKGLKHSFQYENNLKIHLLAVAVVFIAGYYAKLSRTDWCMLLLAMGLVLVTEIMNTAIERLVDLISPQFNPKAGLIKDIAAGAVLVASVTAAGVGLFVFLS